MRKTEIEILARGYIVSSKVRNWTHVDPKAYALTPVLDHLRGDLTRTGSREWGWEKLPNICQIQILLITT